MMSGFFCVYVAVNLENVIRTTFRRARYWELGQDRTRAGKFIPEPAQAGPLRFYRDRARFALSPRLENRAQAVFSRLTTTNCKLTKIASDDYTAEERLFTVMLIF